MFRLLGFLIGSATSIAIILLVTGIPEFHMEDPEIDQKRFDEAVEKLLARKTETDHTPTVRNQGDLDGDIGATNNPATMSSNASNLESISANAQPLPETNDIVADAPMIADSHSPPGPEARDELQWYSFWNPFRSEIAAHGFVSQLENVTGLDYRVVKVKAGVYEVAFGYVNDDERRDKLSQITMATGLDLPDS